MRNKQQVIGNNSSNPTLVAASGGAGQSSNNTTTGTSSSNSSNLPEILSLYLDVIHSRVSDLIEITNEYKVIHSSSSSVYSLNAPSQGPSTTAASTNLDTGGLSGGGSQFGDRNLASKSAPSSQMRGKK